MSKKSRYTIEDLLKEDGNSLQGNVLIIKNTPDSVIVDIKDPKIERVKVYTSNIYLVLSSDNNVKLIELQKVGSELALKNARKECNLIVNSRATISRINTVDGLISSDTIHIDNNKTKE